MKTIVRIQFGSHLYGTATPSSDLDFKSVHLPSGDDILLQRVANSLSIRRSKAEGEKNNPGDIDDESYSLQRFLALAAEGQTVALDMLFAPEANQQAPTAIWRHIQENRQRLLTRKSAAFVGYCRQQANKYGIKGSRVAAAKLATEHFHALTAESSQNKVRNCSWSIDQLVQAAPDHIRLVEQKINSAGDRGWFIEVCNRKISFDATVKQAYEIVSRIYQNYGDRARKAETNESVDWKALSHAVRVGEQALELLRTAHVTFPLPCREEILAIKQGQLSYDVVAERIENLLAAVEQAAVESVLSDQPDLAWIDGLVLQAYKLQVEGE